LRGFDHEFEIRRHFGCPGLQHRGFGHAIERVVDLHGSKMLAVEAKHLLVRQILRVERSLPFLVGIPARADVKVHSFAHGIQTLLTPLYLQGVFFSFFVASRTARALRSCFLSTPSMSSGSLFGVQPKQGTPPSASFLATFSSKVGMPLSDNASRQ